MHIHLYRLLLLVVAVGNVVGAHNHNGGGEPNEQVWASLDTSMQSCMGAL
jgi:hypothetical protein